MIKKIAKVVALGFVILLISGIIMGPQEPVVEPVVVKPTEVKKTPVVKPKPVEVDETAELVKAFGFNNFKKNKNVYNAFNEYVKLIVVKDDDGKQFVTITYVHGETDFASPEIAKIKMEKTMVYQLDKITEFENIENITIRNFIGGNLVYEVDFEGEIVRNTDWLEIYDDEVEDLADYYRVEF